MSDLIIGRNSCMEAMRAGRKIRSLTLLDQQGRKSSGKGNKSPGDPLAELAKEAKKLGIPVEFADRAEMDRIASGGNHQGAIARADAYSYSSIDEIVAFARKKGEAPFIILLDGIEDPHNLGAIIRTAECAGAHGIVIPRNRAAQINETVHRTSAGAAEHVRCARVTNLARAIEELKEQGIWVYACDMGESLFWDVDLGGAVAIVIGSEGKGVGRLVREKCDGVISMPLAGKVNSLNASNAAALAMYEVVRQRREG